MVFACMQQRFHTIGSSEPLWQIPMKTWLEHVAEDLGCKESEICLCRQIDKDGVERWWWERKEPAILQQPLSILNLTVRCENILKLAGIKSIRQLTNTSADELMEANCGITALRCFRDELARHGLTLRGEDLETLADS